MHQLNILCIFIISITNSLLSLPYNNALINKCANETKVFLNMFKELLIILLKIQHHKNNIVNSIYQKLKQRNMKH